MKWNDKFLWTNIVKFAFHRFIEQKILQNLDFNKKKKINIVKLNVATIKFVITIFISFDIFQNFLRIAIDRIIFLLKNYIVKLEFIIDDNNIFVIFVTSIFRSSNKTFFISILIRRTTNVTKIRIWIFKINNREVILFEFFFMQNFYFSNDNVFANINSIINEIKQCLKINEYFFQFDECIIYTNNNNNIIKLHNQLILSNWLLMLKQKLLIEIKLQIMNNEKESIKCICFISFIVVSLLKFYLVLHSRLQSRSIKSNSTFSMIVYRRKSMY